MIKFILYFTLFGVLFEAISPELLLGVKEPVTDTQELSELTNRLEYYLQQLSESSRTALELAHIHEAYRQISAGNSYELLVSLGGNNHANECTIVLWEKMWEKYANIETKCDDRRYQLEIKSVPDKIYGKYAKLDSQR